MKKLARVVAVAGIAGAAALAAPASAQAEDPLLAACATADGTSLMYCEPPVDCAVYYENDCFPTNFDIGLEREDDPEP